MGQRPGGEKREAGTTGGGTRPSIKQIPVEWAVDFLLRVYESGRSSGLAYQNDDALSHFVT